MPTTELAAARAAGAGRAPELNTTVQRIRKEIDRLQLRAAENPTEYRRTLGQQIAAGGDIPEDLPDRLASVDSQAKRTYDAAQFLSGVQADLRTSIEREHAAGADLALAHLHTRVETIQDQAVDLVGRLHGARNAQGVLDAGAEAAQAWRGLEALALTYDEVRHAQGVITREGWPTIETSYGPDIPLAQVGIMRDIPALWPYYADRSGVGATAPWPHADRLHPYRISHDRDFLIWAAESGAQLWVPTLNELRLAHQHFDAAKGAARMAVRGGDTPPRRLGGEMHVEVATA